MRHQQKDVVTPFVLDIEDTHQAPWAVDSDEPRETQSGRPEAPAARPRVPLALLSRDAGAERRHEDDHEFLAYIPKILAAATFLGLGFLLSRFVYGVVQSGAALGSVEHAPRVAAGASLGVMVIAFVVAIDQLGVSTDLLVSILTTLVAVVGLSMGAAFALGARPIVTHILAVHYLRKRLAVGDEVEIEGRHAVVERVGPVDTLFRSDDAVRSVPNGALLEQTIEW